MANAIIHQNYLPDPLFWLYQDNYRTYNVEVAKKLGVYAAIFLSELASKQRYHRDRNELTEEGFFFFTQIDMEERTCLTRDQQEKAIAVLISHNLIEKRVIGVPAKRFFRVNPTGINALFFDEKPQKTPPQVVSARMVESRKLECGKVANKNGGKSQTLIYTNSIEEQQEEVIIANPKEGTPAAGNNNFFAQKKEEKKKPDKTIHPCLEQEDDLTIAEKQTITEKFKDLDLDLPKCLELVHREALSGPKAKLKYLQKIARYPESFKQALDDLGQPKQTKAMREAKEREIRESDKENRRLDRVKAVKEAVSHFKDGKTYNGYKCVNRNGVISFYPPPTDDPISKFHVGSLDFEESDFVQKLHKLLKKLGVDIPAKV